ncbi:hypothetical protein RT717_08365 [Imperialibacter roseus]|uniref:Uncharacterized protein n=1 Tax=Imperialibacter roseus TaxID=1324217 RepID=A0ABZ0IW95_9BACT|nr:hypothetical protein [Imperialibacter roseus]WOK08648.1 hypothetical protein RT717_08365 [Imperialibacter roseus]
MKPVKCVESVKYRPPISFGSTYYQAFASLDPLMTHRREKLVSFRTGTILKLKQKLIVGSLRMQTSRSQQPCQSQKKTHPL